jgi:ankyrin repeat protein
MGFLSSIFGTPESQLVSAIANGNLDKVKQLIAKNPNLVNAKLNKDGDTALSIACDKDNLNIVNVLIKAGADVNATDNDGETVLMRVSNVKIVNALIKAGADVNATDNDGNTAVIKNSDSKYTLDIINTLIQAGADLEAENKYGNTALITACQGYYYKESSISDSPRIETVKVLIQGGANVNTKTSTGNTALKTAQELSNKYSSAEEIVNILIKAGAKPVKKKVIQITKLFRGGRRNKTRKHVKGSKRKTRTRR